MHILLSVTSVWYQRLLMSLTLTYTPHWLQTVIATLCGFDHVSAWVAVHKWLYMQAFTSRMQFTHCAHRLWELTWHAGYRTHRSAGSFTTLQASSVMCVTCCFSVFWPAQFQNEASVSMVYAATQGAAFVPNVPLLSPSFAFISVSSTLLLALSPPAAVHAWCLVSPSGLHWGLPLSSADNYCHLHIAQCDKHLALPAASRGTATLV